MPSSLSRLRSIFVDGPAGPIECLLEEKESDLSRSFALVCHPHPLFGGTMHNKVVHRMASTLHAMDYAVLRFNFRGVGRTAGVHDNGIGETQDAVFLLQFLKNRYPHAEKFVLAGFSFGSYIATQVAAKEPATHTLLLVSPAIKKMDFSVLTQLKVPKLFIQGTADDICPHTDLESAYSSFLEPKKLVQIANADHFYQGQLTLLADTIKENIA